MSQHKPTIHHPLQMDLVEWLEGAHRRDDPETSKAAAKRLDAKKLNRMVLRALKTVGPMTTEEIAFVIRQPLQSVTPRMAPLERHGMLRRTDRTKKGRTGRLRIVWEVAPE